MHVHKYRMLCIDRDWILDNCDCFHQGHSERYKPNGWYRDKTPKTNRNWRETFWIYCTAFIGKKVTWLYTILNFMKHFHLCHDLIVRVIENHFFSRFYRDFSDIFQPLFIVIFSWSMLTICSALLIIKMELVECIYRILLHLLNFILNFMIIMFSA